MAAKKKAAKRKSRAKVKKPTKAQAGTRRDVTIAHEHAQAIYGALGDTLSDADGQKLREEHVIPLIEKLADIDARTGRRQTVIKRPVVAPDPEVVHTHPGSASHVDGNEPSVEPEPVEA